MVLPAVERSSGEAVTAPGSFDSRVPGDLLSGQPARLIGSALRSPECPDGRHLWDAFMAMGDVTAPDVDRAYGGSEEQAPFTIRLTCVRCGLVQSLGGIWRDDGDYALVRVDPVPVQHSGLVAQHVAGAVGGVAQLWQVWTEDGRQVGSICARYRAPRPRDSGGCRRWFVGRLDAWPLERAVRAAGVQACLAGLAPHVRGSGEGAS